MIQKNKKIAVVIAKGLNGIGAIRSLNKAGFETIVISDSKEDLSIISRLPKQKIIISNDEQWESNLLSTIQELDFASPPAIIACSDQGAKFLSENYASISKKYKQLSPDIEVTNMLNDKKFEIEHMKKFSIDIPKSITKIPKIGKNVLLSSLGFPVIIKPRTYLETNLINAKNIILRNHQDWQEFYSQYKNVLDRFVAQEVIKGDDDCLWVCNATFDKDSNLLSAFTFQRLGTMPSHFGVTSIAISKNNEHIKNICKKLGESLSYTGSAMFEFKYNQQTNKYLYIETNPRIGMCNWFDTCCGVNNVAINCSTALEIPIQTSTKQKDNILYVNLLGDITARIENSEKISLILGLYLKHLLKVKVWAVYRFNDPYPFLISFGHQTLELLKRFYRRLRKNLSP